MLSRESLHVVSPSVFAMFRSGSHQIELTAAVDSPGDATPGDATPGDATAASRNGSTAQFGR